MTSQEFKILKIIWQLQKGGVRTIAKTIGFGLDYSRLVCEGLVRRDLIKLCGRDTFVLTSKGELHFGSLNAELEAKTPSLEEVSRELFDKTSEPVFQGNFQEDVGAEAKEGNAILAVKVDQGQNTAKLEHNLDSANLKEEVVNNREIKARIDQLINVKKT